YLSGLEPVRVLRLQGGGASGKPHLRNLLVIVQFTLAIALLAATSVVWLQMRYVRNFDLGFDKEQVLLLAGSQQNGLGPNWNVLKQTLREYPGITHVTEGGMQPGSETTWRVRLEGGSPQGVAVLTKRIGFDFFATYGIPLIAGRDFDASLASDVFVPPANAPEAGARRGAYVLSEAAVRALGFAPEDVLGHRLDLDFSSDFSFTVPGPVIGVVADVYLDSLHSPLQPLVYFVPGPLWGESPSMHVASLRIEGAQLAAAVDWIGERWREFTPGMPVLHHFLDADFDALYQTEERQGRLFTFFAVLTIVIACLGIFGLASFTVERRFREIGVRKVMGGSAWSIVWLLTNDFSRLVLIANVIAWPLAYVAMRHWLDNFAYRIDLTPMIFLGSGLIALCVAWVTVGGTAAKAANAKPVLALRYE
ncbi:MAG TPA: FtsX-like permease family protein, partial [Hyphomicrobiales bacterium]|nr:FtsX-like permease family protein [Hyphomicrobiales bacterium]